MCTNLLSIVTAIALCLFSEQAWIQRGELWGFDQIVQMCRLCLCWWNICGDRFLYDMAQINIPYGPFSTNNVVQKSDLKFSFQVICYICVHHFFFLLNLCYLIIFIFTPLNLYHIKTIHTFSANITNVLSINFFLLLNRKGN